MPPHSSKVSGPSNFSPIEEHESLFTGASGNFLGVNRERGVKGEKNLIWLVRSQKGWGSRSIIDAILHHRRWTSLRTRGVDTSLIV